MRYYPIFLDVANRSCLVVGAGAVGCRKALTLMACGARVTVVAPVAAKKLLDLAAAGSIEYRKRTYEPADLDGMLLVIGATDDETLNLQIKADADRRAILCNIADHPEACHFILPSVVARGDLLIAVSTSGKSPAFAKKVRQDLEATYGPEYAAFLKLMGAIRRKLLQQQHAPEEHRPLFEQLIDRGLVDMIKDHNRPAIDSLLQDTLGQGYAYDTLMQDESGNR